MRTKSYRRALLGVVASLALVATACGDGDATAGPAQTAEDTPTTQDTASTDDTGTGTPGTGMMSSETMAALPTGEFGPGCSAIPADGEGSSEGMADDPVATAASNNPALSTLVDAVTEADLVDTLNSAEQLTVFAPSNEAFQKLPADTMEQVMGDQQLLTEILTYHVHTGDQLDAQALADQGSVETINEQAVPLEISAEGETVSVEGVGSSAEVVCGNVETANATVHIIDTILLPQEMTSGTGSS